MMDATLGYILCSQSPTLFLAAVVVLLCYFARRRSHHARAVLDLVLCIVCAAAGVALYFFGMGRGYFTIRDFYVIRTPAWIGMAVVAVITVWVAVRAFLAANRRRVAVAHVSETVSDALTEEAVSEPNTAPAMPDPAEPITLTLENDK